MSRNLIQLKINGVDHEVAVRPYDVLLDVLRENLNLIGTKRGCDMGTCGCCTVLRDGRPVLACLTLVMECQGAELETIDEAGAWVAADDFICTGRRLYPAGNSPKPLRRMAQSLLGAPPDSTRGSSVEARIDHLIRMAREHSVQAAVFYIVKFCEPELFYQPLLRKALERHGIRCVEIEVDISDPYPHQATTRLEALLETVA